jgi:hypothetical protein
MGGPRSADSYGGGGGIRNGDGRAMWSDGDGRRQSPRWLIVSAGLKRLAPQCGRRGAGQAQSDLGGSMIPTEACKRRAGQA